MSDDDIRYQAADLLSEASSLYDEACKRMREATALADKAQDPSLKNVLKRIEDESPDYAECLECRLYELDLDELEEEEV